MCTRSPCGKSSVKKPGWNLNLVDESMKCMKSFGFFSWYGGWHVCVRTRLLKKNIVLMTSPDGFQCQMYIVDSV